MDRKPFSFGKATLLALVLSTILSPLLVIGPFLAGFAARKKMGGKGTVIGPAILPAILWAAAWYFLVNHSWQIGKENINLAALGLTILSPITAISIIAGAIAGAAPIGNRIFGILSLIGCLAWLSVPGREIKNLYKTATGDAGATPVSTSTNTCASHLKKLFNALQQYADAYDGTLPPADNWTAALQDPIQSFIAKEDAAMLTCPQSGGKGGYAMNKAVGGKRIKSISDPNKTPLLYDSSSASPNANDEVTSLPSPGRHGGKNHILNINGTITDR